MHHILALSALPLLAPFAQALRITTNTNRQTGIVDVFQEFPNGIGLFSVGPETAGQDEFSFSITIEPEDASEGGGTKWGLVQNIICSTRLSTYDRDNFIRGRPSQRPPVLDGGSKIIPFFDDASRGTLDNSGSLTLTITDGPRVETVQPLYLSAQGSKGDTAALNSFHVDETFRITLVQEKSPGSFSSVFQCDWSYSYTFTTLRNGSTKIASALPCQTLNSINTPIVQGPVATEGAFRLYDPEGNFHFNEARFTAWENLGAAAASTFALSLTGPIVMGSVAKRFYA